MTTDTERLFVQLEARVADFEKKMKQAERRGTSTYNKLQRGSRTATRRMERDMLRATGRMNAAIAATTGAVGTLSRTLGALGLPLLGTAGFAALARGARGAVTDLSNLNKAARDVSMDVEELQGLMRGFERATRITGDQATQAFERFNRRVGEAANGTGEMNRIVERYGIRLHRANGELRDQGELVREVANAIRDAATDQERAAIAQAAFGDVGRQMAAAMREGEVALDRMIREAMDAGDVIDRDLIQRAEDLDDRFDELTRKVATFFKVAAVGATDFLAQAASGQNTLESLFGTEQQARDILGDNLFEDLADSIERLQAAEPAIGEVNQSLQEVMQAAEAAAADFGTFAYILDGMGQTEGAARMREISDAMSDAIDGFRDGEISAQDFLATIEDTTNGADTLRAELESVDATGFDNVVAHIGTLQGALSTAIGLAASLRDTVSEAAGTTPPKSSWAIRQEIIADSTAERERAAAALRDFLTEEDRLASRTRDQIDLERELSSVQSRAREEGVELTEAQAKAQAQANLELRRSTGSGGSPGGGGGGGSGGGDFMRTVESVRERTRAMEVEAQALAMAAETGRDYGQAMDYAQTRARLMNAALSEGMTITPELEAAIDSLADAYARTGEEAEISAESMRQAQQDAQRGADAMTDLFMGIMQGSDSAKQALAQLLMEIARVQMQQAMLGLAESDAGGILGFVGGLLGGGFASGGYTGHGGTHEPAGVVHRGEYVFSKRAVQSLGKDRLETLHRLGRGYASGGHVGGQAAPAAQSGGKVEINVRSEPGTIVEIARNEAGAMVTQGLREFSRTAMPARVQQISRDPRRR